MDKFLKFVEYLSGLGSSDFHLTGGHPPVFRREGRIHFDKTQKWTPREIDDLVGGLLTAREKQVLRDRFSVDLGRTFNGMRVRINIFFTLRGLSLAGRFLPGRPPTIDNLNLHPSLHAFTKLTSGLILVCGSSGSGKSTTLAAMVEEINRGRTAHIITLEDPIEFRFLSRKSFIQQREIGSHVPDFEQGLIDVLREDPDVIMIGELREPETMRLALNAAESGRLILASLHASNSEDGLYRIENSFPPQAQDLVRHQLASTLAALVVQKLIKSPKGDFRVPCLSILRANPSIKGLIRENRLSQLEGVLFTSRREGMFTMEQYEKEYLAARESFVNPAIYFRPSGEASPEPSHRSALAEPGGGPVEGTTMVSPGAAAVPPSPAWSRKKPAATSGGFYVIEEDASLDDILNELHGGADERK
ncbi:MAG: ATPase, T2SS/T4P/T4SS family [Pseudomonadota bacterium]